MAPATAEGNAPAAPEKTGEGGVSTKYKYGSTQVNISADSEAAQSLETARTRISQNDLAGQGKDIGAGGNHVTVRYGVEGEETEGIKKYLSYLAPFEASLGKTDKFPPSEHSDGASVIIAPIEAPELHQINSEIEKHGDFAEPSFPEYKPHATVAYVKPEVADRYVGMGVTHGKKFTVNEIAITDRNGKQEVVKLGGKGQLQSTHVPSGQAGPPVETGQAGVVAHPASQAETVPQVQGPPAKAFDFQPEAIAPSGETKPAKAETKSREREILGMPPKPGEIGRMRVGDLKLAPEKFQYKLATDAKGTSTLLKDTKVFNPELGGVLSVWRDPADGYTYVVNGHHRAELAARTGYKTPLDVRHIKAANVQEARAVGARQNIAEGRGTPVDAAKFFRDTASRLPT